MHVYTKKGKGFAPAEADQIKYHAISKLRCTCCSRQLHRNIQMFLVSGYVTKRLQDDRLLAITPAMCEGSGMVQICKAVPRAFL